MTKLPTIEVFAGDTETVEEGGELELAGSFTRPEGVRDLSFRWEFGDGSTPATGALDDGVTKAVASHEYADHRPFPYKATLTITAQSDAGEVEASGSISVLVSESTGWVIAGWSAGDTWKSAVRTLSGLGQGIGTFLIWLAIFSPVWIVGGGAAVLVFRRLRHRLPVESDAD